VITIVDYCPREQKINIMIWFKISIQED
jgi:hypothetical protein